MYDSDTNPRPAERWVDPIVTPVHRAGAPAGPLTGLTFAVKDLFDVAGHRTGAGNPTWAAEATPAASDAPAVAALLSGGASLVGKTITDELAYSLAGTNVHHGTPVNPAAPGRVPGGSSAGSASAVAAGRCHVALGTDTGGSVRVPASYCGIWGMRPTHGRIPVDGLISLAPSFDTVGWFARDGAVLAATGRVLLDADPLRRLPAPRRVLLVDELVDLADESCRDALVSAAREAAAGAGLAFERATVAALSDWWRPSAVTDWLTAFRTIQSAEAWSVHGSWIERGAAMGPGVRSRFLAGRAVGAMDLARAISVRESARRTLERLTLDGTVIALPAASGVAPLPEVHGQEKDDLRHRTLRLTCGPGLAGLPALAAPLAEADGLPVGLCLLAAPWGDEALLDLADQLAASSAVPGGPSATG